jgi:hypothetical protein
MTELMSNNAIELQARSATEGHQALRAAHGLTTQVRDRAGRVLTDAEKRDQVLRERVNDLVGLTFYGTLLKTMRTSGLKGPYGHGGRGEEVFRGQLDMLLARRAGQARWFELNEAIYRRLTGQSKADESGSNQS